MAGINRLGKAPPKPGTLRPPDPNKYRTVDMFSEGAEGDADYMRMVQDIEDMQQQQGWLFGRGAFDKGDLLYLRDEAEKQRHAELELRDSEKTQFAALRAKFEKREGAGDVIRIARKDKGGGKSQPELLSHVVRVKSKSRSLDEIDPGGETEILPPPSKKSKAEIDHTTEVNTEPSPDPDNHNSTVQCNEEATPSGLGGLLGDYGSSSSTGDDNDDNEDNGGKLELPTAAELLDLGLVGKANVCASRREEGSVGKTGGGE